MKIIFPVLNFQRSLIISRRMEEVNLAKTFILNFEEYFDLPKGLG